MMSVNHKCKYSIKMIPLIMSLKRASATTEEFEQKLGEFFTFSDDPVQDLAQIKNFVERANAGDNYVASTSLFDEVEQARMGEGKTLVYDGTARAMYGEDSDGYNTMKTDFIKSIVESVLYNPTDNIWYDVDKEVNDRHYSHLDIAIFDYKTRLINTIRKGLSLQPVNLDINSETINADLTEAIKDTLIVYQNKPSDAIDATTQQAYVILFNFNDLLQEHAPFIVLKNNFKSKESQAVDMYEYVGPKANVRTGWSNEDRIVGAKEEYSGLAKILLNYFQEYDGGFIPGTSIGVDGFIAAMKSLRLALLYSNSVNLEDAKKEYYKGDNMDIGKMINDYLEEVKAKNLSREHSTNLEYKLKGILYSIYANDKTPADIKSMFTRMFQETVAQKYRTLGTFSGEFKASNLEDNWIRNQNYSLQETINGKILGFRENPANFDAIKKDYNINLSADSSNESGTIELSFRDGDRPVTLKIEYSRDGKGIFDFKLTEGKTYDGKIAERLIYNLTGYLVTPEYKNYTKNVNGENNTALNDFAGAIGISILGSIQTGNVQPFRAHNILDTTDGVILFHKGMLFNQLEAPAKIASLVAGSETANTVKDVNGHNLPTAGLTSLAYETDEFITRHGNNGIFDNNLVKLNPGLVGAPIIQEGITVNGRGKKNRSLNVRELYEFSIIFNFLNELPNGTIYIQPTVNADKTKVLVPSFDIIRNLNFPGGIQYNLQTLLNSVITGNGHYKGSQDISPIEKLDNALMLLRETRYTTIAIDLLDKYNEVFKNDIETPFNSLEQVDKYLINTKIKYNDLRKLFRGAGIEFIEEHTATKSNGIARVNETLLNKVNTFNGDTTKNSRFQKRLDRSKRRFAYDVISDGFKLNPYVSKGGRLTYNHLRKSTGGSAWYEESSRNIIFAKVVKDGNTFNVTKNNVDLLLDPSVEAIINPILEGYFYANAILADEYNVSSIGEDYSHANKSKTGDPNKKSFDETEWEEFSEASRWVSSVKRNVIPGASLHPLLQYKWDGVAESIKVAAMSDISAATFSIFGVKKDDNDSMDGSGLANIWEILLEKNSLMDAAPAGFDLKTIGWDLDENGIPMMLKWAVYGITNERRRKGFLSKANVENLYRRMNNITFNKYIAINNYFNKYCPDGFFFLNPETQQRLHVKDVIGINREDNKTVFYRVAETESGDTVYLDKHNKVYTDYNGIATENLELNTIYDLDMFFGGAWAEVEENGRWKAKDLNYQAVLDIICSEKLKDYFIAYAVNKSAMKVGVRNLNDVKVWTNDDPLDYFNMSTKHIGLQMNAEHELEFAEVTEMTQMISALAENWYAGAIVQQIYKDIGAVVEESLASIGTKIRTNDIDGLRIQFGKALIESFDKKEDTIGLAQAFLNKARAALKEGERPNIPFSAATINGAFIADVASRLTKKGIRRKYSGIAAVLSPAYNMMSYFRYIDPETQSTRTATAESMPRTIRKELENRGLTNFNTTSIWALCNSAEVVDDTGNTVLNPFIDAVARSYDIKQGDTIVISEVIGKDENNNDIITYKTKLIESWDDYNKYVNNSDPNVIGKLRFAPRDLQGGDIIMEVNGKTFSVFNLHSVIALHALNQKIPNALMAQAIVQDPHWAEQIVDGNLKKSLQNIIQKQLEDLENGRIHDSFFGKKEWYAVQNVNTVAAECIMGKSYAEQFGLLEGDDLDSILKTGPDFFYNRMMSNYGLPDVPIDLVDTVLYTKNGPILVKFGDILHPEEYNLSRNLVIRNVDGELLLNNSVLCSEDGVQTYSYNKDGQTYNILTINNKETFDELLDSELVETNRFVITNRNLKNYINFTEDTNAADLLTQVSPEEALKMIREADYARFTSRVQALAKQRYYAFRASLNIVGARIPTQAMQSFMPMKVVAFTNSTTNDIYVPRTQLWLQGSDLDIDKVYCLQYSINSNGTLATMSRLDKIFDPIEVLKLGKPNGVHYKENSKNKETSYWVSYNDLMRVITTAKLGQEKGQLDIFLKIFNSGKENVRFQAPLDLFTTEVIDGKEESKLNESVALEYNEAKRKFLYYLNQHSLSKVKLNKEAALRNMVVSGILEATLKPSVQGIAGMPIDMDEAQKAAENSVLNDLEKHFSPDIPSSKWKLQVQALGAKDVVGISAVSVKCFFGETTYINMMMEQFSDLLISNNVEQAVDLLNRLLIKNPITNKACLISNVNLRNIIDKLNRNNIQFLPIGLSTNLTEKQWDTDHGFDIIQCLKDLNLRASIIDTALSESGILSSATDNMKELILPKLNATSEFVDIYTSLLSIGVPFDTVANIMTSPMFTEMSRLTQSNLLDGITSGYRLKTALEFFLNMRPLPRVKNAMLQDLFEKVGWVYEKDQEGKIIKEKQYDVTKNLNMIREALEYAYKQRINSIEHSAGADYYGQDEDFFLEGYFNEEYMTNNKVRIEDASLEDLNRIINYLEECLNRENLFVKLQELSQTERYARFGSVETQLENLKKIYDDVLPRTEEQRILGRMLGINQGLRTDPHEMYSMIRSIENFINTQFTRKHINKIFVLANFLKDPEYQKEMCDEYDRCKWNVNVLKVVTTIPHFKAMFDVLYQNEFIQSALSSKHQLVNNIARMLENEFGYTDEPYQRILNEKEYTQVERFVNDWYITGWLAQQQINVNFPLFTELYSGLTTKSLDTLKRPDKKLLNTLYNQASFKRLMEKHIIPDLQKDDRFNGKGDPKERNSFIMSLEYNVSKDRTTKKLNRFYRLPLNMMTIDDSTTTIRLYEKFLKDFNKISNVYLEKYGQTIGDLFFLYNLIVNKDSFGRSSFTRLFENQVATKRGSSLINSFYDYIASIDSVNDRGKLIGDLTRPDKLNDLKARIHQNVATSNIAAPEDVASSLQTSSSDFTFDMPYAAKNWESFIETVYPVQNNSSWGRIKLEKSVLKQELLKSLQNNYGNENIIVLTESQWNDTFDDDEIAKYAPALIDNGKVYIRRSDAASSNSIAHEFAHVILAGLRFNPEYQDFYYNVLGKIDVRTASEIFGDEIEEYQKSRVGVDLKEEIFAKYLEKWLSGKVDKISSIGAFLIDNADQVRTAINTIFGTNITTLKQLVTFSNMTLEDAIDAFGSSLFNVDFHATLSPEFLVKAQRIAALKEFLVNKYADQRLTEECD